ncbi:hypothetical protein F4802DRAFT_553717 [Xylaria palmicola]|nr:hypothetical protein F4802DRAFT_553717 [Xylaria palmicola]
MGCICAVLLALSTYRHGMATRPPTRSRRRPLLGIVGFVCGRMRRSRDAHMWPMCLLAIPHHPSINRCWYHNWAAYRTHVALQASTDDSPVPPLDGQEADLR